MPRSKNSQASAATMANRSPKTVWNDDCDRILISVLEQAKRDGQMANNGFKQAVWKRAENALEGTEQQSGGPRKGAAACTNRFSTLKKDYKDVKFLLTGGASGFGWNEETRTVTAPDSVWEDFLVKHSHLAKWRERSFPLYEELGGLIDGRYAVGKNVFHAGAETESEASDTNAREDIDGANIDDEPDSQVAVSQDETQVTSSSESSRAASAPPTMAEEAQEHAVSPGGDPTTSTSAAATPIASQNEASTGSGRKRSAEEEESEVHRPVKRARRHARSQRTNTASSLEHIAESLQDVARAFILDATPTAAPSLPPPVLLADSEPPPHLLDVMATPARRRVAIRSVERDGGLAPFDFVKAVKLIQGDIAIADVYLAMQQPQNRREFITSLLADM